MARVARARCWRGHCSATPSDRLGVGLGDGESQHENTTANEARMTRLTLRPGCDVTAYVRVRMNTPLTQLALPILLPFGIPYHEVVGCT